jgi:DNA-binding transcriptional MerR regulator
MALQMKNEPSYTLEELAGQFGLTPRTARYYIENVLPPHHKKGRGKLASYGQDTWNCFAFIQIAKAEKLTSAQITRMLAELDQGQIDRVASRQEELTLLTTISPSSVMYSPSTSRLANVSMRASRYRGEPEAQQPAALHPEKMTEDLGAEWEAPLEEMVFSLDEEDSRPEFENIYSDRDLRIEYRGEASREQREQVSLAARLIKRILGRREL